MNSLSEIVSLMDNSDKKEFIRYLNQKNKRHNVKNISYFKLIETDDKIKINNLYKNSKNKDAYHALRKRLYDNLIEFMSNRSFEKNTDEINEALRYLVLSRFFLENGLYKTAFKNLAKAEEKAFQLDQFSLLNEIYQTQIQYLHLQSHFQIDDRREKLSNNLNQIQKEANLNLGYALLRKELQEIHQNKKVVNFKNLVQETLGNLGLSIDEILTYKSLYQILFIANEFGNIHQNFSLLESFINSSYAFLESKKEHSENHLYYHIQIVYFLANFHFRTNDFSQSQVYLNEMMGLMEKKNSRYFKTFYLRHQLLLSLNLYYTGNSEKAMEMIEIALKKAGKEANIEEIYDLKVSLVSFLAQHQDQETLKKLKELTHTDAWFEKKMGMLWTIRKNLLEILVHVQFENTELALSRIQSFKRRYKKYLYEVKEQRVMDYVLWVEQLVKKPEIAQSSDFKNEVLNRMKWDENKDPFILSFWAWLISRTEKKTPFEVVLGLVTEEKI